MASVDQPLRKVGGGGEGAGGWSEWAWHRGWRVCLYRNIDPEGEWAGLLHDEYLLS